jgi:hypothetical protein
MEHTSIRTLTVEVTGVRAGTSIATWGQRAMWQNFEWLGFGDDPYFMAGAIAPLPPEATLDRLEAALCAVFTTFESMRTLYHVDDEGVLRQTVGPGTLPVAVYDAKTPDQADRTANDVLEDLKRNLFEFDREWPMRMAVVTVGDSPARLVFSTCRIVFDSAGSRIIADELGRRLAGDPPGQHDWHPIDQAEFEQSADAVAIDEAAQAFWTRSLAAVPLSMLDHPTLEPEPLRFHRRKLTSPAALAATRALAARHGVSAAAILLAAYEIALSVHTGHRRVVMQVICGNRVGPRRTTMIGTLTQDGLFTQDLDASATFGELARRSYQASVETYLYGFYDPVANRTVRREQRSAQGAHIDLGVYFNDGLGPTVLAGPSTVTTDELNELLTRSTMTDDGSWERVDARLFLTAADLPDAIALFLLGDSVYAPPARLEAILYAVERILVAAVDEDLPADRWSQVSGLTPVDRGDGWVRCRRTGWVDLPALGEVWHDVGGGPSEVFAESRPESGDATGHRLIGYAVAGADDSVERRHRDFMTAIDLRTDVRSPDWYVLCAAAPTDRTDPAAWRAAGVVAEGAGH